jgi:hypothetical protein
MTATRFCRLLLLTSLLILFGTSAFAQFRGSIRGVVTDSQGAVLPGTTVTLTNIGTNAKMTAVTDDNGIYVFNALPNAQYQISAEHSGFKKKVLEHVQIIPDQANALDLTLEVGQVQEAITVTGTTEALNTETATTSGTINANQIQHLPTFGRDVIKLAQLAPGVFGDNAQGSGGGGFNLPGTQTGGGASGGSDGIFKTENGAQIVANGNQTQYNGISIDGISTTSAVWGGSTIITPSEDSVDNVKIVSNSYDAEQGRFSGADIQVTSKGGTNQYHGGLFFVANRPGLNAYQRFNGGFPTPNQVLRDTNFFSQFGGNLGGPIWKNKIFGFFNYETVRSPKSAAQPGSGWYEASSLASQAPAGSIAAKYLSFPGSQPLNTGINDLSCGSIGLVEGTNCQMIPGQGLDIGSPLTTGLGTMDPTSYTSNDPGVGGGLDGTADIANYSTLVHNTTSKAQYNGRVDANVTEKDRLAFALYWVPQSTTSINGPARAYNLLHHSQINEAFSLIWNRVLSPTFVNEARANAAGWHWNELASNPQSPIGLPQDSIQNVGSASLSNFGANVGSILNQWTYTYKDVATKVWGRHTIKFGGELTRLYYLNNCAGCGIPQYNFFNIWDFLNDAPRSENSGFDPHTGTPFTQRQDDRENVWGFFAQDDFKLRRNLTVNFGLRWSYFGPLYSKQNNMYRAIPGQGSAYMTGLTVVNRNSWDAQKNNFGPQIGFAWSPSRFNDKLVVRGGYGLNYDQEEIAISANINANPGLNIFSGLSVGPQPNAQVPAGILYAVSSDIHNVSGYPANPAFVVSFGPNGLPTTGTVNVGIFPQTMPTMRVHHYSLQGEYDLGHNLIATLGYQGSLSRNLLFHENPNALPAALGYPLNLQIGGGDYWSSLGYGNYNAMLAELKHTFSQRFMADVQFTWSKSMDTSSGPYFEQPYVLHVSQNYGRSDFDAEKAFKMYAVWQPVIFHGNNMLEKIAGGWTLTGIFNLHTGFPWSPVVNVPALYCSSCGYSTVFPAAYLGGAGSSTSNDAFKTGSNYPNGGAAYFSAPTITGNIPPAPGVHRNSLNGPGYRSVDMTLAKAFGLPNMPILGENAKLEFRAEAYNLFNNLNFNPGNISNNINNSNFGQATAALSGRVVTLGLHFNF